MQRRNGFIQSRLRGFVRLHPASLADGRQAKEKPNLNAVRAILRRQGPQDLQRLERFPMFYQCTGFVHPRD